jgi:hypothetical protein
MTTEELEVLLEITLGEKLAEEVSWEAGGDPCAAAEVLSRKARTLAAPFRDDQSGHRFGSLRKDIKRLQLVSSLLEETAYELDEKYGVELVRSA